MWPSMLTKRCLRLRGFNFRASNRDASKSWASEAVVAVEEEEDVEVETTSFVFVAGDARGRLLLPAGVL